MPRQGKRVVKVNDLKLGSVYNPVEANRGPAGRDVFGEGDQVDAIALLISGVVRGYKIGETGRQITLYRFGDGQSCILTANAILSRKTFPDCVPAGIFSFTSPPIVSIDILSPSAAWEKEILASL